MKLTILGCHSATPKLNSYTTAQVLDIKNHLFLIDCGEGTQMQLRRNKVKFSRIKHIFISHLHGDHYFGLVGLISTFRLLGREADLHIYAPKGLKDVITMQMKLADSWTNYKLIFHELTSNSPEVIFEDDKVEVQTIPLKHRVYTNGFLIKEKENERKLLVNKAVKAKVNVAYYKKLKQGFDVENEIGELIKNEDVTEAGPKSLSYAFCSDTVYDESIIAQIKNVEVLYHEATFLNKHAHLATPTKHSTASQAAQIALQAEVGTLVLGHYSTRYDNLEDFRKEAMQYFNNVELAEDSKVFEF